MHIDANTPITNHKTSSKGGLNMNNSKTVIKLLNAILYHSFNIYFALEFCNVLSSF